MSAGSTGSGDGEYTLVDVGGYRLAIHCIGEGSPTVVLETGLGAPSEYWAPVQQEIAGLTRVCLFDRAGRGKSDPAPTTLARAPIWSPTSAPSFVTSASRLPTCSWGTRWGHEREAVRLSAPRGGGWAGAGRWLAPGPVHAHGSRPCQSRSRSPDSHKGFYRFWAGGGWRDPANNPENVDFVASREQLRAIHSLGDLPWWCSRPRLPAGATHEAGSRAAAARDVAGSPARAGQTSHPKVSTVS
jgi:hypothetical protein